MTSGLRRRPVAEAALDVVQARGPLRRFTIAEGRDTHPGIVLSRCKRLPAMVLRVKRSLNDGITQAECLRV
jgi:hypothetical protein